MATIIGDIYWDSSMYKCPEEACTRGEEIGSAPLDARVAESSLAIVASEILPLTEPYEFSNVQMIATGHVKSVTKQESVDNSPRADHGEFSCFASYEIGDLPPDRAIWVSVTAKQPPFGNPEGTDRFTAVPLGARVVMLPTIRSVVRCDFAIQWEDAS